MKAATAWAWLFSMESPAQAVLRPLGRNYRRLMSLLVVVLVLAFHTNVILWGAETGKLAISPSLVMLPVLLVGGVLIWADDGPLRWVVRSFWFRWAMGFTLVTILWFLATPQLPPVVSLLIARIYSMVFFGVCLMLFSVPGIHRLARQAMVATVLLAVALNLYELAYPMTFSEVLGRSAGLYINPNIAGMTIVLGVLVTIDVLPQAWRGWYFGTALVGVICTFSRGGMLEAGLAGLGLVYVGRLQRRQWMVPVLVVTGVGLVGFALLQMGVWDPLGTGGLNLNSLNRIAFRTGDNSFSERAQVAMKALEAIAESPLWGNGLGATRTWAATVSTHNIYLNLMMDHGVWAVLIYPLMLWSLRSRDPLYWVILGVALLMGLFTHNVLDLRPVLMSLACLPSLGRAAGENPEART